MIYKVYRTKCKALATDLRTDTVNYKKNSFARNPQTNHGNSSLCLMDREEAGCLGLIAKIPKNMFLPRAAPNQLNFNGLLARIHTRLVVKIWLFLNYKHLWRPRAAIINTRCVQAILSKVFINLQVKLLIMKMTNNEALIIVYHCHAVVTDPCYVPIRNIAQCTIHIAIELIFYHLV